MANADEHRQVRFTGGWETADYVVFEWRDLRGEMVYLTANDDSVSIDFPLTAGEIPRLFRVASRGEVMLGKSGRGSFLLGTAFGQRFTIAGSTLSCFTFLSSDSAAGSLWLRLRRHGAIAGRDRGFPARRQVRRRWLSSRAMRRWCPRPIRRRRASSRLVEMNQAEPQGLTEVPLGYAVLNPISGG